MRRSIFVFVVALTVAAMLSASSSARAGKLGDMQGFEAAFGFDGRKTPGDVGAVFIKATSPGSVFWPGEKAGFQFQLINASAKPAAAKGKWEVIEYATRSGLADPLSDVRVIKVRDIASVPMSVEIAAKGFADVNVELPVPEAFGAYAIVLSLDGGGKQVAATCVRSMKVSMGKVFDPAFAIDAREPEVAPLYSRLGIRGTRQEWGAFDPKDEKAWARMDEFMKTMSDNDITVMLTLMTNSAHKPMNVIRGLLNDKAEGKMDYPGDFVALPEFDAEFQEWVKQVSVRYGWPKGPLNAVELWNEPWEGSSISGWGADLPRYREIYTHMAQGVEQARKEAGVKVLIGGACSSMNTEDKLFPDGNDEPFLKWLDFTSIHYQPLGSEPVLIKRFAQRKNAFGPTRVWDTETWLANSEERLLGTLASMRAQGLERTAGIMHDYVRNEENINVRQADGKPQRALTVQALAPAVAVAAADELLGQRKFKELLFKNGLPWVFVFDGLADKGAEDGTAVVVGDLGMLYERDKLLYKNVLGVKARQRANTAQAALAALPADATVKQIKEAVDAVRTAEVLDEGSMTLADAGGHFRCFDVDGNAVKPDGGKLVVPLSGAGYFLRTDGSAGAFSKLLEAMRTARVDGLEPASMVAHDLLSRIDAKPSLRLTITNVLNRPINGKLTVQLKGLQVADSARDIALAAHETKELSFPITGGTAAADNTYALTATLDAGADGRSTHEEAMHVNVIARRQITVDGTLDDWKDVLPQPIRSQPGSGKNLTEKAWLPFKKFDDDAGQGFASGYLAYDDQNFYFAARIADTTPEPGNIRFAKRDDDSFYYPQISYNLKEDPRTRERVRGEEKHWPEGVRRFSYRRDPLIPSGSGTDNVQVGFNVLPIEQTDWLAYPPGTMPRFMCYKTTDYEFALNSVADAFGGGTEIWRLLAPGMPRKHFYPRQPKAVHDGGPVDAGKLVMKRDGNTRIVECALPWSEIPDVKKCLDKGQPIKFTFRVNDNKGPSFELNGGRSVSKIDTYSLHDYWATSWAVETEFAFEK